MMAPARFGLSAAALIMATTLEPSFADMAKGSYTFSSSNNCASSGKMPTDICGFAHASAEAEFEEKAPRYPTRSLCEQVFGAGACSLGFRGADGWAGKKKAIYFSPRQQGFRITISSDHGITVVPLGAPGFHFSRRPPFIKTPRSILGR